MPNITVSTTPIPRNISVRSGISVVNRNVFNVVSYGADPTGTTECSAAIQLAIDAASAGGGGHVGTVYFPHGEYLIGTTLSVEVSAGIRIEGAAKLGSYLRADSGLANSYFDIGFSTKSNGLEMGNLTFNNQDDVSLLAAIRIGDINTPWFHDLYIRDTSGSSFTDGILVDPALGTSTGASHCVFERIQDSGPGATTNSMIKGTLLLSSVIRDLRVSQNSSYGVILGGLGYCQRNDIYGIRSENGLASGSAMVKFEHGDAASGSISFNNVYDLHGAGLVDYGVEIVADDARDIHSNNLWALKADFAVGPFNVTPNSTYVYGNLYNGVGYNTGDPSSTGAWNTRAADGVRVVDESDGSIYSYADGEWKHTYNPGASAPAISQSWSFARLSGNGTTHHIGGFYDHAASDNDFNPAVTHGTANGPYAAHVFLVSAAGASGGTDTVVRVTGTTITDAGVRAAGAFEEITIPDDVAADTYFETSTKFLGQVSIEKQSGPDLLCNYGFCKYWDNLNANFTIVGFEALWNAGFAGNMNVVLVHHKSTGWTYRNGDTALRPTYKNMQTTYNTEYVTAADQDGAYKLTGLSQTVSGSGSEGFLVEVVTGATPQIQINYGTATLHFTQG